MLELSSGIKSLLNNKTHRFAALWKIERLDGVTLRFTDHNSLLSFENEDYTPMNGFDASARQITEKLEVANFEATGVVSDDAITDADLKAGLYNDAKVTETIIDWQYPWAGFFYRRHYWIANITKTGEIWRAEVEGLARWLRQKTGKTYSRNCPAVLGDERCQYPVLAKKGTILEVISKRQFKVSGLSEADGWYDMGVIDWGPDLPILVSTGTIGTNIGLAGYDTKGNQLWYTTGYVSIFPALQDLAASVSRNIYAAGGRTSSKSFWKFDKFGKLVNSWDTGGGTTGIAVDSSENIYVCGSKVSNKGVWAYNSAGNLLWSALDISCFKIAVNANGVYVISTVNNTIYRLSLTDGSTLNSYTVSTSYIYNLCFDLSGNVYVCGYYGGMGYKNIWKLTSTLGLLAVYDVHTIDGGAIGRDVYVAGDGSIYLASASVAHPGLYKLDSSGAIEWFKEITGISDFGSALGADSQGNIYIGGKADSAVALTSYEPDGTLRWQIGVNSDYDVYAVAIKQSGAITKGPVNKYKILRSDVLSYAAVSGGHLITIFDHAPVEPEVDTEFLIYPGCNKTKAMCRDKFDNVVNYRGYPFIPGRDAAMQMPEAR